jgi:hypothetical protein
MFTRASLRVVCALTISLTAFSGITASPAGATATTPVTITAIASWQTSGATASNVSLQVTKSRGTNPVLFFFVSQQFCDTAHNQEVFRSFNGTQPANRILFAVAPDLSGAVLGARRVPMTGTEQRIDGCSTVASRVGAQSTSLGSFSASIFAGWISTGPNVDGGPGITTRDGVAFGLVFSRGPLGLGFLGRSQFAQLRSSTVAVS